MTSGADRRSFIKKIIQKAEEQNIHSQYDIQHKLKTDYHLDVSQGTISKDLKRMGATIDRKSGKISLIDPDIEAERKEKLSTLLTDSKMELLGASNYSSILVKVEEKYAQTVAFEIMEYFKDTYVFPGLKGALQILIVNEEIDEDGNKKGISTEKAKGIENYLREIQKN